MPLLSAQDLLYLIGSVALLFITIFLCWALYEIARLARQGNEIIGETREKAARVEQTLIHLAEKMGAASQYLGLLATAARELFSWLRRRPQAEEETDWEDAAINAADKDEVRPSTQRNRKLKT